MFLCVLLGKDTAVLKHLGETERKGIDLILEVYDVWRFGAKLPKKVRERESESE